MAIFNKKRDNGIAALEREHADILARRDRLRGRLNVAETALASAVSDRRKALLNDTDDGGDSQQIMTLGVERDAIADALAEIEARIEGLNTKLVAERERQKREAAAQELSGCADALAAAIGSFEASIAPLAKSIPAVTGRTPYANLEYGRGVQRLLSEVATELHLVVTNAKNHCAALLTAETVTIRRPEAPVEVLPSVPEIERLSVMPIADVSWIENGQTKTAPRWSIWALPVPIAQRGIAAGWLFDATSETVARLRAGGFSIGDAWHTPDVRGCLDLSVEKLPRPPAGSLGRSLGEIDPDEARPAAGNVVEQIGEAITGTASAS